MKKVINEVNDLIGVKMTANEIISSIKVQCFFVFLNKTKGYTFETLDFSDFNKFSQSKINGPINDVQSHNYKILIHEIICSNLVTLCDELNTTFKIISNLDISLVYELFDTIDSYYKIDGVNSTNTDISNLICLLNKDRKVNSIIDLCSGTGSFLGDCAKYFKDSVLNGIEVNDKDYLLSKLRLEMIGNNYKIENNNIFDIKLDDKHDLVFCNYPWLIKYSKKIVSDYHPIINFTDIKHRADWAFVSKAINSISENGKAYVIMPNGCLFNVMESSFRKELVEKKLVEMIIAMPFGTIFGTNTNYSIVVFSKNNESIKMIDGTQCFIKDKTQRKIDVSQLIDTIKDNTAKCINNNVILENDANLDALNYFKQEIHIQNPIKLEDIATTFRGYQYNLQQVEELAVGVGEYSVVKIGDLNDDELDYSNLMSINTDYEKVKKYLLKENDILISSKGTVIKFGFVSFIKTRQVIPTGNLTVIRVTDPKINPLYLYVFLKSPTGIALLNSIQTGSVIISLSKKALDKMNVPALDLTVQKEIIDRYNEMYFELKALKQKVKSLETDISMLYESVSLGGKVND